MSAPKVRFFFDYASPYSYIASLQIEEICGRHGAELLWEPFVLGGVFQADQTTPAHALPKRRNYMLQDLLALSQSYDFPFKARTEFVTNAILPMRTTVQIPQGSERTKAVHALFRGIWAEDKDLSDPETTRDLLLEAGLDGDALVTGAQQQSVKDQLRANTDEALSLGVFGAPTCFLNEEKMFWGHDRLKLLDYFLGKPAK